MSDVTSSAAKRTDEFIRVHPTVNLLYFAFVLGFTMCLRHPVFQLISLACGIVYSVQCEGKSGALFGLKYAFPLIILTALINPAFNHEGVTVLAYLPLGNPLTLESILYGISAGLMLASALIWFSHVNRVLSSDKLVYLFGRVLPSLSLLLSMTLRFIPRFHTQIETVREAQKSLGVDTENGSLLQRIKSALRVFSVVVTWSLENAIETSDSMKSRGYGTGRRTAYALYRFEERDRTLLITVLAVGLFVFFGSVAGGTAFRFYPRLRSAALTPLNILLQAAFGVLCLIPVILNRKEAAAWKAIRSKM